jgi:hypothetical protein
MSQNDFTIANQSFPAFRADLNSALQAIATNNSGATEPSTTFANMWWYDSSNNIMYIRNEDNDAWIKFAELDQTNDKFVLSGTLQLDDGTVSAPALTFNSDTNMGIYRGGTDILKFVTAGTDAITIDASQNVGIGQSPSTFTNFKILEIKGGTAGAMLNFENSSSTRVSSLTYDDASDALRIQNFLANPITLETNNTEAMRIDISGNLLVGKTAISVATVGVEARADGIFASTRSGGEAIRANRTSSDGDIIQLRKDNTTVGSIGAKGGDIYMATDDTGIRTYDVGDAIIPVGTDGASRDNAIDLGISSVRFDDIYATNATIQTSDRNEKQDIEELSDAEQRVAVVAKGLMRKFRWIDSVAEKGDNARTHFGIIAQDLQDAFTAEGLDAGDYAMFTSNTWWQKEISVDAVVADEANGIEAKDAYTYMDTKDEATEGYTEKTRLGVRYNQLLAFIISAI